MSVLDTVAQSFAGAAEELLCKDDMSFAVPPGRERPLDRLVALQRADGSWDLTKDLARVLGKKVARLEDKLAGASGDAEQVRRAWATALAIIWLNAEASDSIAEWVLLEKKARKWLDRCPAKLAGGKEWLEAAAELFSRD